jgi:hypothetical protein
VVCLGFSIKGQPLVRRLLIVVAVLVLSPVIGGGIYGYGCINRIVESDVLNEAKQAYLQKIIETKQATAADLSSVKCGRPEEIADYFYGISVGIQWRVFCAYIKDERVLTSEEFSINKCRATADWTYVDEGFPKPLQNSGYGKLL